MVIMYNRKSSTFNGPEETTQAKQGVGKAMEVGIVNGWRAVGGGLGNRGDEISVNEED